MMPATNEYDPDDYTPLVMPSFLHYTTPIKMPNKSSKPKPKPRSEAKVSYTYPSLHKEVSLAISGEISKIWFNNQKASRANNEYSTTVMGKFICKNGKCPKHGWSSKKVAILIKGYAGNGYSAIVFNQRCQSCNELGILTIDKQSYIERVAYRLKKWAGVRVDEQYFVSQEGLPHKPELCEGCKRGYCQRRRN